MTLSVNQYQLIAGDADFCFSNIVQVGTDYYMAVADLNGGLNAVHRMYKASGTSPTTSAWTEQDSANRITNNQNFLGGDRVLILEYDGTDLWVHNYSAYQDGAAGNAVYSLNSFDPATDTWGTGDVSTIADVNGTGPYGQTVDLLKGVKRSDGDLIVTTNWEGVSNMGTDYVRTQYHRREGGTWTTGVAIDAGTTKNTIDESHASIAIDGNDLITFFWTRVSGATTTPAARTLTTGNSLNTIQTYTTGLWSGIQSGSGAFGVNASGTDVSRILGFPQLLSTNSVTNPTTPTTNDADVRPAGAGNLYPQPFMEYGDTDERAVWTYKDTTNEDLYLSYTGSGNTTVSDNLIVSLTGAWVAVSASPPTLFVNSDGDKVAGFCVNNPDTGDVEYYEWIVEAGGPATITGTGAGTIAAITGTGSGTVLKTVTGTGAIDTPAVTTTGTAIREITGSGAGTITAVTGTGQGNFVWTGTGAIDTPPVTGTGAGDVFVQITGTGAGTITAVTGTGDGVITRNGTGAGTITAITGTGSGIRTVNGTHTGTITAITGTGTGTVNKNITGTGAIDTPAVTGTGTGEITKTGTGAIDTPAVTGTGTGTVNTTITGTGAGTITAITGTGTGTVGGVVAGTGAIDTPAVTGTGTGTVTGTITGTGAGTTAAATGTGAGTIARNGTGAGTITAVTGTGSGIREITGTHGESITLPTSSGTGTIARDGTGAGTTAAATGTGSGTVTAAGPDITGTGAGTITAVTGAGTGERTITATGAGTITGVTGAGSGQREITGTHGETISPITGTGTGTRVITGTGAINTPSITTDGFGGESINVSFSVTGLGMALALGTANLVKVPVNWSDVFPDQTANYGTQVPLQNPGWTDQGGLQDAGWLTDDDS